MTQALAFPPPRQRGLVAHAVLLAALGALCLLAIWQLTRAEVGLTFILYLLLALATFAPLPFAAYRLYSLLKAGYFLTRDNLTLQWGLRSEVLPLSDVEWVRPATDLTRPLRLPPLHMPGAILGMRRHPDIGPVEFLASESETLLLVATARRVFAISPRAPGEFTAAFQRFIEMGSLAPMPASSEYPSFLVAQAWQSPLARYLWLSSLFLNIGLAVWTGLLVPQLARVPLGFDPQGAPLAILPGVQLMTLPLISAVASFTGWLGGLYFYREAEQRVLAFILWLSSMLTPVLFLIAVGVILTTPI